MKRSCPEGSARDLSALICAMAGLPDGVVLEQFGGAPITVYTAVSTSCPADILTVTMRYLESERLPT